MFGLASGANCPTAQMAVAEAPETAASELSPPPTLGLPTTIQSPVQAPTAPLTCVVAVGPPSAGVAPHEHIPRASRPMPINVACLFIVDVVFMAIVLLTEP